MSLSSIELCKLLTERVLKHGKNGKIVNPQTDRSIKLFYPTFNKLNTSCNMFTDCSTLRGMANPLSFTCYIDTILFILLSNKYIEKKILFKKLTTGNIAVMCNKDPELNLEAVKDIQTELRLLSFRIKNAHHLPKEFTCHSLLSRIKKVCPKSDLNKEFPPFYLRKQRSPLDVIHFLFRMFQFDNYSITETKKSIFRKTKDTPVAATSVVVSNFKTCIWHVPSYSIQHASSVKNLLKITNINEVDENNPIYEEKDKKKKNPFYYVQQEVSWKTLPPFFIMDISRVDFTGHFMETKITPDPDLKSGLHLFGIIVQRGFLSGNITGANIGGGHYVAYFKCDDQWYLYDDMSASIQLIGDYKKLLKTDAVTRSILFFYSKT
jgi:hypothetical protein